LGRGYASQGMLTVLREISADGQMSNLPQHVQFLVCTQIKLELSSADPVACNVMPAKPRDP
jgi:hypothetical protein